MKWMKRVLSALLCAVVMLGLLGALPGGTLKAEAASSAQPVDFILSPWQVAIPKDSLSNELTSSADRRIWYGNNAWYSTGHWLTADNSVNLTRNNSYLYLVDTDCVAGSCTATGTAWGTTWNGTTLLSYAKGAAVIFNDKEKAVLEQRNVRIEQHSGEGTGSVSSAYTWPLSETEAWDTLEPVLTRVYNTVGKGIHLRTFQKYYSDSKMYMIQLYEGGRTRRTMETSDVFPTFIACNLRVSDVFLIKNIESKQSGVFQECVLGSDVKFTLKDTSKTGAVFTSLGGARISDAIIGNIVPGQSYIFKYTTSTEMVEGGIPYISAVIYDSTGKTRYYSMLAEASTSGEIVIKMPEDLVAGDSYTLCLFEEEVCGGNKTDYAYGLTYAQFIVQEELPSGSKPVETPSNSGGETETPKVSLEDTNDILSPDYEGRVSVDFIKEMATFHGTEEYEIAYASMKMDKNAYINNLNPNVWEDCTGETQIDLSWVPKTKESALIFKFIGSDGSVIYDMLPCSAQDKTLKVGMTTTTAAISVKGASNTPDFSGNVAGSKENGYLYFYTMDSKSKAVSVVSPSSIEWKKGTGGNWNPETDETVAKYFDTFKKKGVTLYFRIKSDNKSWPSKEVKLSFKKQANAPSIKLTLKDLSFNIKEGQEYKVRLNSGTWSDWINVLQAHGAGTKKIVLTDLYTSFGDTEASREKINVDCLHSDDGGALDLQVRTAANEKKSTLASKSFVLSLKVPETDAVCVNPKDGEGVTIAYKNPEDKTKGLTITNSSDLIFEYAVTTQDVVPTSWSSLKAGKTSSISASKYSSNSVIAVRIAGDVKAGKLPSVAYVFRISELDGTTTPEVIPEVTPESGTPESTPESGTPEV